VSDDDGMTAAERRLLDYVHELPAPQPQRDLVAAIVRAARWQAVTRPYLATAGALIATLGTGAGVLLASPRRPR